ncbi:hypothetical protein G7046_g4756 [Stylonectria norvegica]|nr:hypothetical protein G7046_g4756 [Stylonectria norvegica]
MATPTPAEEAAPVKKIKRTSFSPWSSGAISNKANASANAKKDAITSPEPARIVSDILLRAEAAQGLLASKSTSVAGLSTHPKILAVQREWEGATDSRKSSELSTPAAAETAKPPVAKPSVTKSAAGEGQSLRPPQFGESGSRRISITTPTPTNNFKAYNISSHLPGLDSVTHPMLLEYIEKQASEPSVNKQTDSTPRRPSSDRRPLPSSAGSQPSSSVNAARHETKAHARLFTQAAVMKQFNKVSQQMPVKSPSEPKLPTKMSPMPAKPLSEIKVPSKLSQTPVVPPSQGKFQSKATASASKPSMQFTTPDQLLNKIKMGATSATSTPTSTPMSTPKPTVGVEPVATLDTPPAPILTSVPLPSRKSSSTGPQKGERIVAILIAEGDRPYTAFPRPDGTTESGRGLLTPPNYKLHDHPTSPYICPVRDCRRLFTRIKSLGSHFSAGHCSNTYNDNGDGTLSKVGTYIKHGAGSSPGIVVSKNPLAADAPPTADPGFSAAQVLKGAASTPSLNKFTPRTLPQRNASSSGEPNYNMSVLKTPSTSEVGTYLHSFLHPAQKQFKREDIRTLLSLPRKRPLPPVWIETHRETMLDVTHYSCALAYMTGYVVRGPEKCMANKMGNGERPTSRLSIPCVALPHNLHSTAKACFSATETCVGCRYWSHLQRRSNHCDWSPSRGERSRPIPGWALSRQTPASSVESAAVPEEVESVAMSEPMEAEDEDKTQSDTSPEDTEPVLKPKRKHRRTRNMQGEAMVQSIASPAGEEPAPETRRKRKRAVSSSASGEDLAIKPVQISSADLEMEDWEVAPGRMRDEAASQNIGFSNSYLTSGQPITVSEDISFNVLVVKPGSTNYWGTEDDKLRTCSVASGKIKVTMGQKIFHLGPNGMFVVRPGQTCKVENRLYLDSVVHCTTIANFELR